MTRKVLRAAHVSQMSNPDAGTGSGGDRCTESVTAMLDATYELGPRVAGFWQMSAAAQEAAAEAAMYSIVALWNGPGVTVSALESGSKIADWLAAASGGKITIGASVPLTWEHCQAIIDRGHVAVIGMTDYSFERYYDGTDPVNWPETEHAGHVELLVGYDDDLQAHGRAWGQTLIVHDPLRAYGMMPADYTYESLKATGATLSEVSGPALLYLTNTEAQPVPTPAPVPPPTPIPVPPPSQELATLQAIVEQLIAAYAAWKKS